MMQQLGLMTFSALVVGCLLAISLISQIRKLTARVESLERRLAARDSTTSSVPGRQPATPGAGDADALTAAARSVPPARPSPLEAGSTGRPPSRAATAPATAAGEVAGSPGPAQSAFKQRKSSPGFGHRLRIHLQQYWMIWLGGLCVALAGIFLARYAVEQGMLGQRTRVALGLLCGAGLHVAAELFRRKTGESHPAFAALAGGGSITLFAVLLASMRLYDLLSPGTTFVLLALVAILTMWLARLQGPFLAAIGIVGAYLVPVLVSSGEGRILVALVYALIISASALLLMRYVFRPWLWWAFVAGAVGWWMISLGSADADYLRGYYLAAVAYLMLCLPYLDWLLRQRVELPSLRFHRAMFKTLEPPLERYYPLTFGLLGLAQCLSVLESPGLAQAFWIWSPLPLVALVAARNRENLNAIPWLLLLATCATWVLTRLGDGDLLQFPVPENRQFLVYLAATAALYTVLALRNLRVNRFPGIWSSLAALAPLLLLALGYLLTSRMQVSLQWGLCALTVALVYLALAGAVLKRSDIEQLVIWLLFGGHFAFSLAAIAVLEQAQLTLAIALQMVSLAWIMQRFAVTGLGWLLKLIVSVVIVRLTLNPWLATYPEAGHWSLWTYGGATLCAVLASRMLQATPMLSRWTEGAALHLFVLTLWTELRYWLYDGAIFSHQLEFLEVAIYMPLFGLVGLVYYRRSLVSQSLAFLYQRFSVVLACLALLCYLVILMSTLASKAWVVNAIGATPIANLSQLAFGVPVLLGLLYGCFHDRRYRNMAFGFCGLALFAYASIQIRHLFQGSVSLHGGASDAELYTYSIVWLAMSIVTILGGAWRLGQTVYRAGMLLLALVIGKLFLVDMNDLEGLLRIASFMGLGIALLGISYLHQRIQRAAVRD
ncbi:DUF2339 domain-containing protein [Haliea sp. E17]|uniref:DUF2339 domain-containing protein n=1 Tax=Haliea sp. E17 TaxID=3401576 RepID=UPI003AAAD181